MLRTDIWVRILTNTEANQGRLGLARGSRLARYTAGRQYLVLGIFQSDTWYFLIPDDYGITELISHHLVEVVRTGNGDPLYYDDETTQEKAPESAQQVLSNSQVLSNAQVLSGTFPETEEQPVAPVVVKPSGKSK